MSAMFRKYSEQLRSLNDEYYQGHISFSEYRQQRNAIFGGIENDMNGGGVADQAGSDNVLDKILSYFKSAETDEQSN